MVGAAAIVPLAILAWRAGWSAWTIAVGVVAIGAGVALLGFGRAESFVEPSPVTERPVEQPHDDYLSSSVCKSCHPREYATWYASYHRTMTQVASPSSVLGSFDDVQLQFEGHDYRMHREGDAFFVETDGGQVEPGSSVRTERRVVMTTGSHHFQFYWFATPFPNKLGLFPFAHRISDQRWMPLDAMGLVPPGIQQATAEGRGRWNRVCVRCHSTGALPRVRGPNAMDTQVGEFGIACESCHGPGAEHVRVNRKPWVRYGNHWGDEPDASIVQPERLSHRRSSQVCGQCHAINGFKNVADRRRWAEHGTPYRPGDEISDTRVIATRDDPHEGATRFWPDGEIRINGREYNSLLRNPCYQRGEMSCGSCHTMHPEADDPRSLAAWADDQLRPGMRGSEACTQCHEAYVQSEALVDHTHHAADSTGSDCMNCHMPNTAYGLQKATRSHEIDIPSVADNVVLGRPNGCNLCHLDQTLAWTAEALDRNWGIASPPLQPRQRAVAAGPLWALSGDAGQRALAVWHMRWGPAREASGTEWMAPFVAQLLDDPYAAVRAMAYDTIRDLPGYETFSYQIAGPRSQRVDAQQRALTLWQPLGADQADPVLLLDANGALQSDRFRALLSKRDDRPVLVAE